MNYRQSISHLEGLSPTLNRPSLERIALFLTEHGRPQERFPCLHVGGTNGKGSTVAMLDAILRSAGLSVGRFTGPHLMRWNERFHVDGSPISDDDFAAVATRVRTLSEEFAGRHPELGALTWFESLTAMAFLYFAERAVDVAVIEVGLGGRWDATNVLASPLVTTITNVDLDHTQILGSTVTEIAAEKGGIIKPGVPLVTAAGGEALDVLVDIAERHGAPVYVVALPDTIEKVSAVPECDLQPLDRGLWQQLVERLHRGHLALSGPFQRINALCALAVIALTGRGLSGASADGAYALCQSVEVALASLYWPGRFQILADARLVLDGAHNPHGARALRSALDECFPGSPVRYVIGCFENKNVGEMLSTLVGANDSVYACAVRSKRAVVPAATIAELSSPFAALAIAAPSVAAALDQAVSQRRGDEVVVVTGSFAVVKDAMSCLGWAAVEDGQAAPAADLLLRRLRV